jgi:hypothetical protein
LLLPLLQTPLRLLIGSVIGFAVDFALVDFALYAELQRFDHDGQALQGVLGVGQVFHFGLVGVAVGTAVAMAFRTVQYAFYMSNNVVIRPWWVFVKNVAVIGSAVTISCILASIIDRTCSSYIDWAILAGMRCLIILGIFILYVIIFERKNFRLFIAKLKSVLKKKSSKSSAS